MNRSALCIKMLQLINGTNYINRSELAARLETNVRNIAEFKKELEIAGYVIESVNGRYGGYRLLKGSTLPIVNLTNTELDALDKASSYLESHQDFLNQQDYQTAIMKVKSAINYQSKNSSILFRNPSLRLSETMRSMITMCEEAKEQQLSVTLKYKSMHANTFKELNLQPYEILCIKGAYYVLGYNSSIKEFRTYKFSDARLTNCQITNQHFTRDHDFNVMSYIGESGLMKNDLHKIDCLIKGELSLLIYESEIGVQSIKEWMNEHELHLETIIEGEIEAIRFVLSLGSACHLSDDCPLKDKIKTNLQLMVKQYE